MKTSAAIIALLISLSLLAGVLRAGEDQTDVVYATVDGEKLTLDVFQPPAPAAGATRPALLLIHGGAWSAGDKADCNEMSAMFTAQGFVVFTINYRLVTDTAKRWPAQLLDVQESVRWVRRHAATYHVDPARVGVLGGSAGGHIVACMGTAGDPTPAADGVSCLVSCIVMLAGPTDLTVDLAPKVAQGAWTNEQVWKLLGGTPAKVPDVARNASPLLNVSAKVPPTLILQGREDDIVPMEQAELYAAALKKAGVPNRLVLYKGGHGIEDPLEMLRCTGEMMGFLKEYLKP